MKYKVGQQYYNTGGDNYPRDQGVIIQITGVNGRRVRCNTLVNPNREREVTSFDTGSPFSENLIPHNIEPIQTTTKFEDLFH